MSLPAGWVRVRLGDISAEIRNGLAAKPADTPPGLPILRISAVRPRRVSLGDVRFHRGSTDEAQPYHLRDGDLLVVRYNGNPELTASCGMVRGLDGPCVYPDKLMRVRLHEAIALPGFVELAMQTPEMREQLAGFIKTAAGQHGISGKDLRVVELALPPLAEQRRIVARIEALFARTRKARADLLRIAPLAKHYRDRTLANAFDADWPNASVTELAETTFDGPFGSNLKSSDYTSAGTRVVRLENIGHLHFIGEKETFISVEKSQALARHTLQADDVLFSSFVDKEVRVCRLPRDLAGQAINKADCFCIRVDRRQALPPFVEKRLASPVTYEEMREAVHGATRPRIGLGNLKAYRIGLPSLETQAAIVALLDAAHDAAERFEHDATRALALLDHLERSILTRAFRGELVSQDPADGPVSVPVPSAQGVTTAPARRGRPRRAT